MDIVNNSMLYMYIIVNLFSLYYIVLYLQEAHYHLSGVKVIFKRIIKSPIFLLFLFPLISIFYEGLSLLILNICSIIVLFTYVIVMLNKKRINKLKITKRIQRLYILNVLMYIAIVFLYKYYDLERFYSLILFTPLLICIIAYFLLFPIELLINKSYHFKAKRKIKRIKPLIIGITGSAGKTSCKNYLYQMLKDRYITFMTPKSYNTVNGISKSILENMNQFTEIAIIEYGASQKNDIKKSLKLVKPDISLITNITLQHLETFKTEENIVKEKTLLMKNSKVHFYNKLSNYKLDCEKCISFSMEKGGDFYVVNEKYYSNKTTFTIVEGNELINMETNLLGETNIINICACVSILRWLGFEYKYIVNKVRNLVPVESRLELINKGKITIINDSFNSNKNGFMEALRVLDLFKTPKIVITPGVVTGGREIEAINEDIAYKIMEKVDRCYLVNSISSKYLSNVFDKKIYEYYECNSFIEAYNKAIDSSKGNLTILIENDITDIYGR